MISVSVIFTNFNVERFYLGESLSSILYIQLKRVALLLCLLFYGVAKGQVADFTTETPKGCAPLVIRKFTNLSTGNIVKYFWDFGNGNTSTIQSPGTIYFDPGSYTVKLVVEDATGRKDSMVKRNFIIVNKIPDVDFTSSSNSGCVPFTVKFTDKSGGGSGTIRNWEWDFGDGTTSTEQSPSHTFSAGGDYSITLKASDDIGCSEIESKSSLIHVIQFPKASFVASTEKKCFPPTGVTFTNTSSGEAITLSHWDFGDGATSSSTNASHVYTNAGTYRVKLTITNQNGCVDFITKTIVIEAATTTFTFPDRICLGSNTLFVNTSSPTPVSVLWDFGDKTTSTALSPTKRFATAGTFIVKLVNDFGTCKDSITKSITVLPKPTANFSFVAPPATCKLPVNVAFTSQSSGAAAYVWDFGDNTSSTITNPTHSYTSYGNYGTKLVVRDVNGCADSITRPSVVSIVRARVDGINGLPFKGCAPRQQTFTARVTSPEPVVAYLWDLGDGATSTSASPTHLYANEGNYTISLNITTTNGCTDNFVLPAGISITTRPKAAFSGAPRVACAADTIQFTDLSIGTIDSRKWDFGDRVTSTSTNSSHRYSDTGFFTVKLIVGNASCFDTASIKDYIYINPPAAKFTTEKDCTSPLQRKFVNKSVLAQTSKWTFGDGGESTEANPVHTYSSPGTYIVHLHVTNSGCYDDFTDTIKIVNEIADFTSKQEGPCKNNTTEFKVTNINPQNISRFTWDFGDGSAILTTTFSILNYNYPKAGTFTPVLTVIDIVGCTRQISHPGSITVYGPKANFENPTGNCLNREITFKDLSLPSDNHPISSWTFNYGDGKIDTTTSPIFAHSYSIPKKYNLSLIVKDSYGCTDTLSKSNAITITNTKAAFSLSDSIFCNNTNINFINQSTGNNLSYVWSFGDGTTAVKDSPSHIFPSEGVYSVSLVVKDTSGCVDSINRVNVVTIADTHASFSVNDSVISCPPAQINFKNNSTFFASVKWNFDDGNFSSLASPLHYFLAARTYRVKMIVYGHGSCADSTVKDIIVKGPSGSFNYNPIFKCAPVTVNFTQDASDYNKSFTWDFGDGTTTTSPESTVSHVYNEPGKYLPKLFLTDTSLNCEVAILGRDTITTSAANSYIRSHKTLFCDSTQLQFFDSSVLQNDTIASYLWKFGDGATSSAGNPIHKYISSGVYPVQLSITTKGGCVDSSLQRFVKVVNSPVVDVTGPSAACANEQITFLGKVQPDTSAIRWNWDFSNGNAYVGPSPPTQRYAIAGNYTIYATVTNSSGCVKTDSTNILVNGLPDLDAGIDSVICRGEKITLQASGADSYLWADNLSLSCTSCSGPVASPTDTAVYYFVTGTTSTTGCKAVDSVKIKVVQPFELAGMITDTLCEGESVRLQLSGADKYTWSPAAGLSNPNIPNPVASPVTTTLYTITGSDYRNCFTDIAEVPITVYPIPVFDILEESITIPVGNSVTIKTKSSADITNWRWFPTTGLSCIGCAEPVATPTNNIVFKAFVTNDGGCRSEDQVTVNVFCNNGNIFIPNTFSPNNDGSNDVFYPRGKGIAGIKSLQIFNRAGN
ncbi:MAG: hypothetical protein JWR18_2521, partial [Segetibacter sp.]|nr:hypothetical protein [Segetibacter sp.]